MHKRARANFQDSWTKVQVYSWTAVGQVTSHLLTLGFGFLLQMQTLRAESALCFPNWVLKAVNSKVCGQGFQ